MSEDNIEIPLTGGRVTAGVVRIGDTVRKPTTANSEFVRRLLTHLATRKFGSSPEFLGTDDRERDVFTFIEGDVPSELSYFDDAALRDAASIIRRFHDLTSELVAPTTDAEVVCHNDLSPCNFVFRGKRPVAIIDFDASAPGSRIHDLGYAVWLWLDLGPSGVSAFEQRGRIATFLSAYGGPDADSILQGVLDRQELLVQEGRLTKNESLEQWALSCKEWTQENLAVLGDA